jgi:hypothetical protein
MTLPKPKFSRWYITLTGYPVKGVEDVQVYQRFKERVDQLAGSILKYLHPVKGFPELNRQTLRGISVDYSVSIGPLKKRVHSHLLIEVKHVTRIQLNPTLIKRFMGDTLQNADYELITSEEQAESVRKYIDGQQRQTIQPRKE